MKKDGTVSSPEPERDSEPPPRRRKRRGARASISHAIPPDEREILEKNRVEWEQLALVVDRVLFFFGVLFVLGLTVVFFMVVKFTAVSMDAIGASITDQFN